MDNEDKPSSPKLDKQNKRGLDQHARDHVFLVIQIVTPIIAMIIAIVAGCIAIYLKKGS